MQVVFDESKNARNLRKHGIALAASIDMDFESAFFQVDSSQAYGEVRYIAIGFLQGRLYTLVSPTWRTARRFGR